MKNRVWHPRQNKPVAAPLGTLNPQSDWLALSSIIDADTNPVRAVDKRLFHGMILGMSSPRVTVIGAGLGGISAAISLKAAGYDVEVFEKNSQIGGKLNVMEKDGFTFDLGPSIFTLPQFFQDLFERAGKKMEDYVQLDAVTPHWRNLFENKPTIDLYQEEDLMRRSSINYPATQKHTGVNLKPSSPTAESNTTSSMMAILTRDSTTSGNSSAITNSNC